MSRPPLNLSLTAQDISLLQWSADQARTWRGALTDPEARREHDDTVAAVKATIRKVQAIRRRQAQDLRAAREHDRKMTAMFRKLDAAPPAKSET